MKHRSALAILLLLSLLALIVAGCAVSADKNPAFIELKKKITDLEEKQKKTQSSVETMYFDFSTAQDDIKSIKATLKGGGATPQELTAALQRIEQLEKSLTEVSTAMAASKKAPAEKPAEQVSSAPALPGAKKGKAAVAAPKGRSSKSVAGAQRTKESTSKGRGFYYKVKNGDTLQGVAEKHKVSSAQLCRANHLPLSAPLYPGQAIYVPQS